MLSLITTLALCLSPINDTPDQLLFPPNYGDFTITEWEYDTVHVTFEGAVTFGDAGDLKRLMTDLGDITVIITINSGGGMAYEGLDLYWEAENWDNLITVAGSDFGAWSAAALFWLGSPVDVVAEGGFVGFHDAYCDPINPPGCDTEDFQMRMTELLVHEFGLEFGIALAVDLTIYQELHGVSYWIGIFPYEDGTMGWAEGSTAFRPFYMPTPWSP